MSAFLMAVGACMVLYGVGRGILHLFFPEMRKQHLEAQQRKANFFGNLAGTIIGAGLRGRWRP